MESGLKQKLTCVALASAFGLAVAMPSFAQQGASTTAAAKANQTATKASADARQSGRDVRASNVIGTNVENAEGENLGEIKDLIVDLGSQRVHYAVLASGGALGLGEKLFAYPMSAFKPQADGDKLVLNIDKDKLKDAPGFDKDKWPEWTDNRYRGQVDRYFKTETAKAAPRSAKMIRATELIGKSVDDRSGKDAGEIEDLVVNMNSGRVSYAVLDFDKAWSPDDKLMPMPLTAFTFPTDQKKDLVLNVARNQIDMKKGFDENDWPDLNSAEYRRDVRDHLAGMQKGSQRAARAADDATTSSGR